MDETLCGEPGAFRYTWAGNDEAVCCVNHAAQLKNIANAMGYYVQLIPLSFTLDNVPDPWPMCQQKKARP